MKAFTNQIVLEGIPVTSVKFFTDTAIPSAAFTLGTYSDITKSTEVGDLHACPVPTYVDVLVAHDPMLDLSFVRRNNLIKVTGQLAQQDRVLFVLATTVEFVREEISEQRMNELDKLLSKVKTVVAGDITTEDDGEWKITSIPTKPLEC